MTVDQIIADVQIDLDDVTHGQTFSLVDLYSMFNQTYLDWVVYTRCITTTTNNIPWFAGPYYDFVAAYPLAIGVISVFNQQTNRYLFDFSSRLDMDKIRIDYENWVGTPTYWFPISHTKIGVAPNYFPSPSGLFNLCYWQSTAELVTGDTPLFASDMHYALGKDVVRRALESVEEFSKASAWDMEYKLLKEKFKKRVEQNHKSEMKRIMG